MKKKIFIISIISVVVAIAVIFAAVGALMVGALLDMTDMLTISPIKGKLYRVDNVYEEIRNLVIDEKYGDHTILTTTTEGAFVDYDFGVFMSVYLYPEESRAISLSLSGEDMEIWIFNYDGENTDSALYVYDYENNVLYGDRGEDYLTEHFLSYYYSWADDSIFSLNSCGEYSFVYMEFPLSHDYE